MAFDPRKKDRKLPKIGLPSNSEGNNGDIEMYLTPQGLGMFGKFNDEWYPFATAQEKGLINKDVRSILEITSSLTIKNKGLLKLFNSANKYYSSFEQSDFSTEDVNYILPVSGYSEASSFLSLGASNRLQWRSFSEVREDLGITSAEILDWTADQGSNNIHANNFDDIITTTLEVRAGLTTAGAVLNLATKEPTVVANDVLGRINFYAPLDTGLDSDLVGGSIAAVAQDTFSDTVNSTALHFQTGKSETATTKMIIDEDGNVSIGSPATGSPNMALEVVAGANDGILVNRNATTTDSPVEVGFRHTTSAGDATTGMRSYRTNEDTSYDQELRFFTMAGSGGEGEYLTIKHDGKIGIGTTSPSTLLEVQGGLTTTGAIMTLATKEPSVVANDVLGRINFQAPLDTGADSDLVGASIVAIAEATFSDTVNSTSLQFQTGTSEVAATRMTIDEAGNVGIGTASPAADLHLHSASGAGNLWITGPGSNPASAGNLRFAEQEDGNNFFQFSHDGSANTLAVDSNNQSDMSVWDRSNNRLTHTNYVWFYRAFPQVKFSDDSGTDFMEVGLSGNNFVHKTGDTDINFLWNDNSSNALMGLDTGAKTLTIGEGNQTAYRLKVGDNGRMNMPVRGLEFENDHGYFNPLGNQSLAWVLMSTQMDLIRHQTPLTLEYWNGSAWVDGISGTTSENSPTNNLDGLKRTLDGTKSKNWLLDDTWRKFRFVIERESTWAEDQMLALDVGWSSISFASGSSAGGAMIPTVQVEMLDGAFDAGDDSANDWNASGQEPYTTDWHSTGIANTEGVYFYYKTTGVHDNDTHVRITVEFPAWDASAGGSARMRINNIHLFTSYVNDRNTEVWTTNWDRDSIGYGHVTIPSSHEYQINTTKVLDATSLGSTVVSSSLTSVGALNSGSITSGFGTIDTGSSTITTTGTVSTGNIATTGTITPSSYIELTGNATDPGADDKVRLGESSNMLWIYGNHGHTRIGSSNTGWSHFYTDRDKNYFQNATGIYSFDTVLTDGTPVVLASHNGEDLVLRRDYDDTSYNQITIGDDTLDIKLDDTSRLAINADGQVDLTGDLFLRAEGGIFMENSVVAYGGSILQPAGGMYRTNTNAHTGCIKIVLPRGTGAGSPADMVSFWVDVFDYGSRDSFSMYISGYIYQDVGSNEWHNVDAMSLGTAAQADYAVRFCHDGSNHCITIGEVDTGWNYLQITVRNVQVGYTADIDDFTGDWTISIETGLPSTVDETASGNFPIASRTIGTADVATTITASDESSDTTCFPLFSTATTGDIHPKTGTNLAFNSSTGVLSTTQLALTHSITIDSTVDAMLNFIAGDDAWAYMQFKLDNGNRVAYVGMDGDLNRLILNATENGANEIELNTTTVDINADVDISGTLDMEEGNIANVGNIALDTISSDAGTSIGVTLGSDAGDDFIVDTNKLVVEGDTGNVGIGLTAPTTTLDVEGTVSYKHTAFSTAGPTDDLDVSGTTVLEVDTSSNDVTIGGFAGGVQGQVLYIVKTNTANSVILEHNESGSTQAIFTTAGDDNSIVGYGGWTLYCNGTSWFSLSNPTGDRDGG